MVFTATVIENNGSVTVVVPDINLAVVLIVVIWQKQEKRLIRSTKSGSLHRVHHFGGKAVGAEVAELCLAYVPTVRAFHCALHLGSRFSSRFWFSVFCMRYCASSLF